MSKIGIVTIYDLSNYGNRLQNYAVQELLKELGNDVVSLKNVSFPEYKYVINRYHIEKLLSKMMGKELNKKKLHKDAVNEWENKYKVYPVRLNNFKRFDLLISYLPDWISEYSQKFNGDYSAFVTGSDQVFNYRYGRANRIDFLDFAGIKPKVAIAASLGVDTIPFSQKYKYKHYLKKFTAISVREKTAKDTLEKAIGLKNIKIVCDPTIAVEKMKWCELSNQAVCELPEKYIVIMYLGKCSDYVEKIIQQYVVIQQCSVIRLNDSSVEKYYEYGPYEFLKVIQNAQMVFTDSFHTCIFSLIFHTSFYVTKRKGDDENIFSRIDWLLEQYKLKDRVLEGKYVEPITKNKFVEIDTLFTEQRKDMLWFLNQSIKECE